MDYKKLHKDSTVVDLHCDAALQMRRGYDISKRHENYHIDIPRLKNASLNIQVFASLSHKNNSGKSFFEMVDDYLNVISDELARNSESIHICRSFTEADKTIDFGKIAALLAIEGGTALENNIDNLHYFYDKGVRLMTLVHEKSTEWCISWSDKEPPFEGLSGIGRDIIGVMNRLGMIIDISHCADLSALEAIKASKHPVIASHSCARAISPTGRNLSDETIKAIADKGGLIGVTFVDFMLSAKSGERMIEFIKKYPDDVKKLNELFVSTMPEDELQAEKKKYAAIFNKFKESSNTTSPSVETVVDHIDYIKNLVGVDFIGIGSDFDGMTSAPTGLEDCSKLPNITKTLLERGYAEEDIRKILGGNFMRILKEVCR